MHQQNSSFNFNSISCGRILTLALMGVSSPSPLRFFKDGEKTAAMLATVFVCLLLHPFYIFPKNFVPDHLRSGPVTLPLKKLVWLQWLQHRAIDADILEYLRA